MKSAAFLFALLFAGATIVPAYSQVGQDLKGAGQNTTDAAKTGAKKTKKGAEKATSATKKGVKKGTHKAALETEKGASKVKDKTSDNNPQ